MATIRRLQKEDDFHDLILLSRAFFEEYEAHHEEFFKLDQLRDDDVIGYFSTFLEKENRAAFIALQDGRIVGYITVYIQTQPAYWKIKRVGHISALMVEEKNRRAGIARQLLAPAQAFFREQGVETFTVYTAAQNRCGLDFYQDSGLKPLYCHLIGQVVPEKRGD